MRKPSSVIHVTCTQGVIECLIISRILSLFIVNSMKMKVPKEYVQVVMK